MSRSARAGALTCTRSPPQLVEDEGTALRHLAAAAAGPDAELAHRLEQQAERKAAGQCMESAAAAMVSASRLSPARPEREERLLRAVDWMLAAGDAAQARAHAGEVAGFAEGARRYSIVGQLASLDGRVEEAHGAVRPGVGRAATPRRTRCSPR